MFRQTILLVSFVAFATCGSTWFEIGTRVVGEQIIHNQTTRSVSTDFFTDHTVTITFYGGENSFTFSRIDLDQDFDNVALYGLDNGFEISITNFNTTQLTAEATVYGFLPGEAPIDFVSEKINSKSLKMHK